MFNEVKKKLNELGVYPKKSLGQNFLINQKVIDRILNSVNWNEFDQVIEIGPGLGSLTTKIFSLHSRVVLIEFDRVFAQYWLKNEAQEVHCKDALKLDWNQWQDFQKTLLISNLPYQISSRLVIDRCIAPNHIQQMVLMFQKEVAQKIVSKVNQGDYGFLSVVAQCFWDIQTLFEVGPNEFWPSPNVSSRVLKFTRKKNGIENRKDFVEFVKQSFLYRRKLLVKNLSQFFNGKSLASSSFCQILQSMGFSKDVRAQELSAEQFLELYERIHKD